MPILYNCRHAGDEYRITKFDDHMNVESSYVTDGKECTCPAGVRPTCRHREMLPKFIHREHIGDEWFFDYDRGGWVQMGVEWAEPPAQVEPPAQPPAETSVPPLPEGVQMLTLDDPAVVHNAIAEAVGEPEAVIQRPASIRIRRRL